MAGLCGRRLDSVHLRQQLHLLQLLRRAQIPHASHAGATQQPLRG